MTLKECYAILQVNQNSTLDDVKRAYRTRAFDLHPDLNPNDPAANSKFQNLNEAYVILTKLLHAKERFTQTGKKEEATKTTATKTEKKEEANKKEANREEPKKEQTQNSQQTHEKTGAKPHKEQDNVYAAQHEVIQDILADPFARRVFEDIYSEIRKNQNETNKDETNKAANNAAQTNNKAADNKPKEQKSTIWPSFSGKNTEKNSAKNSGFSGKIKNWMQNQIDDEQEFHIPARRLFPGARIRLQIRQGLSEAPKTIDITLPPDFSPDVPIRLKGLGKKVGKWQGDLYLTLKATPDKV